MGGGWGAPGWVGTRLFGGRSRGGNPGGSGLLINRLFGAIDVHPRQNGVFFGSIKSDQKMMDAGDFDDRVPRFGTSILQLFAELRLGVMGGAGDLRG